MRQNATAGWRKDPHAGPTWRQDDASCKGRRREMRLKDICSTSAHAFCLCALPGALCVHKPRRGREGELQPNLPCQRRRGATQDLLSRPLGVAYENTISLATSPLREAMRFEPRKTDRAPLRVYSAQAPRHQDTQGPGEDHGTENGAELRCRWTTFFKM